MMVPNRSDFEWIDHMLEEPSQLDGVEQGFGPGLLLLAVVSSLVANSLKGDTITQSACKWRSAISPRRQAFAIWLFIYTSTIASAVLQLFTNLDPKNFVYARLYVNLLVSAAWMGCIAWLLFFGSERLNAAAVSLVLAAACALAAVVIDGGWRSKQGMRIATSGVPFSLFAGWLVVAATLSVASALRKRRSGGLRAVCEERGEQEDIYAARERLATLAVASILAGVAIGNTDPILPCPLIWGLALGRAPKRWPIVAAIVVACVGASVALGRLVIL